MISTASHYRKNGLVYKITTDKNGRFTDFDVELGKALQAAGTTLEGHQDAIASAQKLIEANFRTPLLETILRMPPFKYL